MRRAISALSRIFHTTEDFFFRHTPRVLLTDTLQVVLAIILIGVGLGSIVTLVTNAPPGAIGHALPNDVMRAVWGFSMLVGGVSQLAGLQLFNRDAERLGMALTILGSLVYACALFAAAKTIPGAIFAFVFLAIAFGFWVILRTSARAKRLPVAT